MQATKTVVRRNTVDIDTRRSVFMLAAARKPADVAKEPHEAFVRHTLKNRMGWPQREPAPQSIKDAAKAIAAQLVARDQAAKDAELAAKAKTEPAA
jgi:hypothetical protein